MSEASTIFTTLDAPFVNFEKGVEPIVWQSSDILVMQSYDLKVPTMAGSTIKYSFSTKLGDISFSTELHAPGQVILALTSKKKTPMLQTHLSALTRHIHRYSLAALWWSP